MMPIDGVCSGPERLTSPETTQGAGNAIGPVRRPIPGSGWRLLMRDLPGYYMAGVCESSLAMPRYESG